jgi:hypothetical protein
VKVHRAVLCLIVESMMPKSGYRLPACAKPSTRFIVWHDASAGEARSENIMLQEKSKPDGDSKKSHPVSPR